MIPMIRVLTRQAMISQFSHPLLQMGCNECLLSMSANVMGQKLTPELESPTRSRAPDSCGSVSDKCVKRSREEEPCSHRLHRSSVCSRNPNERLTAQRGGAGDAACGPGGRKGRRDAFSKLHGSHVAAPSSSKSNKLQRNSCASYRSVGAWGENWYLLASYSRTSRHTEASRC